MSDKLGAVDVAPGSSGAPTNRDLCGGVVGDVESKSLAENAADKGGLGDDGVRVSEGFKVLDGELDTNEAGTGGIGVGVDGPGNVLLDQSRSRVAETMSPDDEWKSWGFMDMVGRVLHGNFGMDDEVDDMDNPEGVSYVDLDAEMDVWQGGIGEQAPVSEINVTGTGDMMDTWQGKMGEPTSRNGNSIEETKIENGSDKMNLDCSVEETDLNGNKGLVSNEVVPGGKTNIEEVNTIMADMLIPKERGKLSITEKEGEFYLYDLVWGKVRSHPWWPGQIFSPEAASDKAAKYFKEDSFLVAYFGDQTFAWNEKSKIKPFRMHFSRMEKQSSADGFRHAVDCALDEVARRIEFGLLCPCLLPEVYCKLKVQTVTNAGINQCSSKRDGGDNLFSAASFVPGELVRFVASLSVSPQCTTDRLQLEIVKSQLMAFSRWKGHYRLPVFEECGVLLEDVAEERKDYPEGVNEVPSRKRKSSARDGSSQKRRHLFGKSHETIDSSQGNSKVKRHKRLLSRKVTKGNDRTLASDGAGKSQRVEIIPSEIPTPDEILLNLSLAAKNPRQEHKNMISVVSLLTELRKSTCLENLSSEKHKGKQALESTGTSGFEGIEDSYWTDRVIQKYSEDQVLFEPEKADEDAADIGANVNFHNNGDRDIIVLDKDSEKQAEYCRTALILNFTNLDSIPSIPNLNEIFRRYGPLDESETEILSKSKRAKVVFTRREDAEKAFSSTGKYSTFGPSLVSYKLKYVLKPRKAARRTSKPKKRGTSQKISDG